MGVNAHYSYILALKVMVSQHTSAAVRSLSVFGVALTFPQRKSARYA